MFGKAMQLSRRHFLAGAAVSAGTAILAACGGAASPTETPKPAATTATSASAAPSAAAPTSATTGASPTTAPAVATTSSGTATTANVLTGGASGPVGTAAPTAAASASVPKGGAITSAGVGTDAKSFHPYLTTDAPSATYQGYVYSGLIEYDPNTLDLRGELAEKFTLSDDKKTVTFTLRDGLKWSDGVPLTSDDFLWTYQQVKKPENNFPYLENLDPIVSYEAKDARTIAVTLNDATSTAVETADAVNALPRHIWEKYDWSDPTKNPEINAPTVSSGMWKLKEWKRDDHATFVANDAFYDGRPNIDSFTVRVFGTAALAYQALKAGEVDLTSPQPSDYKEAKTLSSVNIYEYYLARGSWNYLGFNLRRPALKDPLVRKAICYATDRQGIIDGVTYGLGRPTYSALPQSSWAYNPNVEHYDYDVKKAQALFTQAGYTLNGKKLTKDGQQLAIKYLYATGSKTSEGIATVMQQQLGDLGIAVDVQALEFQALLDTTKKEPFDWDIFSGGWSSPINPYFTYQIWSERSIPSLNRGGYVNKQVEMLFDQASKEFDREKQKALYAQIQKMITDDAPYAFLYENLSYAAVNKRVGGITPTRRGITYNMHKWYVTK